MVHAFAPAGQAHSLLDIVLGDSLTVHVDGVGVIVDIHLLALGGDDPLDDGVLLIALLGEHHHVALLWGVAQGPYQNQIAAEQGVLHGRAADHDHPGHKSEQEDEQRHHRHQHPHILI